MKNVLLVIPPDYDHNFPPLGTPVLSAYLRHHGWKVLQRDWNMAYRDFLLKGLSADDLGKIERPYFLKVLLRTFFRERLRDRYYSPLLVRDNDAALPSLPYDNNTNSSFFFTERLLDSPLWERYLDDDEENTFLRFYKEAGVPDLLDREKVDIVGISVLSPSQAIASLTLGRLIKKHRPDVRVAIGGPWVTLYRRALAARPDLARCFDAGIVFEGEGSFLRWAAAQRTGKDARGMVNVLTAGHPGVLIEASGGEDLRRLPCPDFDGLPLASYRGSEQGRVGLTYEMSRGCYWNRCAYCVDLPLPKPSYRTKDPRQIVRDMRRLVRRYGATDLMLGDPGMSPRLLTQVAAALLKGRVRVDWWCMARLDPGFTPRVFELAARAGLRQINFGFESANDAVCRRLHKGNERARSERIIRDCARAGIKVDLQTMLGLPGETFDQGLETIDFLVRNREFISAATFNVYYLTPENHVFRRPRAYGIRYDRKGVLPFQFFIPFKNVRGMSGREALRLEEVYQGLRGRSDAKGPRPVLSGRRHRATFSLNNESVSLFYRRDPRTRSCHLAEAA